MTVFPNWFLTNADNVDVGGIDVKEGMEAKKVNNALREIMAEIAAFFAGADTIAAAATLDIGSKVNQYLSVTGSAVITSLGTPVNKPTYVCKFEAGSTLTHSTDLIIPGAASYETQEGDIFAFTYEGSDAWRVIWYSLASGRTLVGPLNPQNPKNLLINGGFQINQRVVTTGAADDTYTLDRWNLLTQTNTITIARQTDQEDGSPYNIRLTQAQASAQRMGLEQILEGATCKFLRGKAVTFGARVRASVAQAVRYAILEWTGTENLVTSDVVADWTSGTYTAGNFFLGSNLTISAVGSLTLAANTWTDLPALTATLGSAFNNVIVFVWTEGTFVQNATLDIARAQLVLGSALPTFLDDDFGETLLKCQRYYWKTFDMNTAPASGIGGGSGISFRQNVGASTAGFMETILFPTRRRNTANDPVFYNPAAGNAQVRNTTRGTDCSATIASGDSEVGTSISFTTPAGSAAGDVLNVHITFDSEL